MKNKASVLSKGCSIRTVVQLAQRCCHEYISPRFSLFSHCFKSITHRHQLIYFSDDAVLLGEGRQRN